MAKRNERNDSEFEIEAVEQEVSGSTHTPLLGCYTNNRGDQDTPYTKNTSDSCQKDSLDVTGSNYKI